MTRFLPKTLKAQSLLLLTIVFISSHTLTLLIYERNREESVLLTEAEDLAQRIIGIIDLANSFPAAQRSHILQTAQTQFLTTYPEIVPLDFVACQKSDFADEMLAQFEQAFAQRRYHVEICARSIATLKPFFHSPSSNAIDLLVNVHFLGEGTASFHAVLPHATSLFEDRILFFLVLVVLLALGFGWLMISRLTAPISTLADAATTIGRDLDTQPLAERGAREIRLAAAAFNTMQRRLQRTLRSQTDLVAAISHDLKSALTRLQLRAEMLRDDSEREGMEAVVTDMRQMVMSIIDFVRLGNSREPQQKVNLSYLLENIAHARNEEGQRITTDIADNVYLVCCVNELKRAVQNLLDNAVKYAGSAELALHAHREEIRIEVQDRGPGIPADRLEDVLNPFVTVDPSRSAATGGQGLGLAIASNIAQGHGGTLTLHNRAGGGLCAMLALPLNAPLA